MEQKYSHALGMERPTHAPADDFSIRHPRMPPGQRAKIFAPFAALCGFEEALDRKLERYVSKAELSEEDQARVNQTLTALAARLREHPVVTLCRYVPCADENHEAYGLRGKYETLTGPLLRLDPLVRRTLTVGEVTVEFADILDIRTEESEEHVLPLLHGDVAASAPDR